MEEELDVLIVGAGFAGLHQLYHLRKLGYKVKVAERASGLGGIWYHQTYPGARVDSEVPLYGYSDEELWREWNYKEKYPKRDEILSYFEYVAKKWDLKKDIFFNTNVIEAEWMNNVNKWRVKMDEQGKSKVIVARFFDICVGIGAKPYNALFKGMSEYKGVLHHTNNWPQGVDLKNKKVAVIGTGATGVQLIQEIGPIVGHLTVFQRTPNLALPMHNAALSKEAQTKAKLTYPLTLHNRNEWFSGFSYGSLRQNTFDDAPEVRQAFYEYLWSQGNFHFWIANYGDLFTDEEANLEAYKFWCEKVRARLDKPEMRDKLAPLTPPHAFGTKRPSLEVRYYEVFNQPNVDLVDLKANPIDCFTSTGIRTQDGVTRDFDAILLATGFDSLNGALDLINIKGINGKTLKEKWAKGVRSYLGMTSCSFPNLFFIYNVHSPSAFANGPTCVEIQGKWVVQCIDYMYKHGKTRIEPKEQEEEKWSQEVQNISDATLFSKTASWYFGANVPGKLQEALVYGGGIPQYIKECDTAAENGYERFSMLNPSRL